MNIEFEKQQIERANIIYAVQNLPTDTIYLILLLFKEEFEDYKNVYMIEVKKDASIEDIVKNNKLFLIYQDLNEYKSNAKHLWDMDWITLNKASFIDEYSNRLIPINKETILNKIKNAQN